VRAGVLPLPSPSAVEEEVTEQREEVAEEEKMTIDCPLRR